MQLSFEEIKTEATRNFLDASKEHRENRLDNKIYACFTMSAFALASALSLSENGDQND